MERSDVRAVSSMIFNNDKFIEVVDALAAWDRPAVTAQEVARDLGINHDLVKKVLNRLEAAGLLKRQERIGGRRGVLPFEIQQGPVWDALTRLVRTLRNPGADHPPR
jgi:predicted transcriptional regulator